MAKYNKKEAKEWAKEYIRGIYVTMCTAERFDEETKELMTNFYTNFIHNEQNKSDALRHAILQQIQITKIRYGFAHPFYWGAFIFYGNNS